MMLSISYLIDKVLVFLNSPADFSSQFIHSVKRIIFLLALSSEAKIIVVSLSHITLSVHFET